MRTNSYAGAPGFVNSDLDFLANKGPIPVGNWTIGRAYRHPRLGANTMNLEPASGTQTWGRSLFRIHADNSAQNQTASEGCPIVGPAARAWLAGRDGGTLTVVP